MEGQNSTDVKSNLNENSISRIKEKLGEINRILLTLDWDKRHNQLNPGMEAKYNQLKTEHDVLTKKLTGEN